ncbi:hypothetical protein [Aquibium microcysteis]|uniref:hypothetical protein n=1 Tax=Aquibium microcysteis TaxID=675281 RepID=UPI00165CFF7D|nr:hypothetical protein [Aquibium microcysteis]
MCDPLTITSIALTAGSVVSNQIAASKQQAARDDALRAERIRQRGFDQQASALNAEAQQSYDTFGADQEQRASELGQMFTEQRASSAGQNAAASQEMASVAPTSSNLVMREEANQRGKARDFSNAQGMALGNLRAFGDVAGDKARKQARTAGQIAQIGDFKRGSAGALPLELDAASRQGGGFQLLGDLFGVGAAGTAAYGAKVKAGKQAAEQAAIDEFMGPFRYPSLYGFKPADPNDPSKIYR